MKKNIRENRELLKSGGWAKWDAIETDQRKKVPMPELQKSCAENTLKLDLINPKDFIVGSMSMLEVLQKRRSRRAYNDDTLTVEELSYLLWATQGVHTENKLFRSVPSGGARHPFETYLHIQKVKEIKPGLYRYLPLEHMLAFLYEDSDLSEKMHAACRKQDFVRGSVVTFVWTTIPYRKEWRYDNMSYKLIAIEAGHVCQNLYLASESINCGTCAIGAYEQEQIDSILEVDGIDEFTIYIASVGTIK